MRRARLLAWTVVALSLATGAGYAIRSDRPAPRDRSSAGAAAIVSVGDILLGDAAAAALEAKAYDYPFAEVRSLLAGARRPRRH